jgi:hypothetical protein
MGLGNLNMEAFFLDNLNLEALRKREEYGSQNSDNFYQHTMRLVFIRKNKAVSRQRFFFVTIEW